MSLNPCDRKLYDWNFNQSAQLFTCHVSIYIYIYLYVRYTSDAIGWKWIILHIYNTKYVWIIMTMYVASD